MGVRAAVALTCALLLLCGAALRGRAAREATELRILTWNVWDQQDSDRAGHPWAKRKHLIADEIMRVGADVVGLQEIRRPIDRKHPPSGCADMFADLRDLLPLYEAQYHVAQQWEASGIEEGLALFSRMPVVDSQAERLPWAGVQSGQGDDNHRICVRALLYRHGFSYNFLLSHFSFDAREQPANAQGVMQFAKRFAAPQFLVADFNVADSGKEAAVDMLEGRALYFPDATANTSAEGTAPNAVSGAALLHPWGPFQDAWQVVQRHPLPAPSPDAEAALAGNADGDPGALAGEGEGSEGQTLEEETSDALQREMGVTPLPPAVEQQQPSVGSPREGLRNATTRMAQLLDAFRAKRAGAGAGAGAGAEGGADAAKEALAAVERTLGPADAFLQVGLRAYARTGIGAGAPASADPNSLAPGESVPGGVSEDAGLAVADEPPAAAKAAAARAQRLSDSDRTESAQSASQALADRIARLRKLAAERGLLHHRLKGVTLGVGGGGGGGSESPPEDVAGYDSGAEPSPAPSEEAPQEPSPSPPPSPSPAPTGSAQPQPDATSSDVVSRPSASTDATSVQSASPDAASSQSAPPDSTSSPPASPDATPTQPASAASAEDSAAPAPTTTTTTGDVSSDGSGNPAAGQGLVGTGAAVPSQEDMTWSNLNTAEHPLAKRLDRVLFRDRQDVRVTVLGVETVGRGVSENGVVPSDHRGVLATVQLWRP